MANQLMASSSFSSAPSSTRSYTHDVFLSFRGDDTRGGFTGHLYRTLVDARIMTFIVDELPRGEEISPALFRVIDESKLSLIVFSENYGTRNIRGLIVQMPTADEICLHPKCFKRMSNLKVLINVNGRFGGKVDYFPNQLRLFEWPYCPLKSLPSDFDMKYVVQLNMRGSRISHLGFKSMPNLKSLNLAGCGVLAQSPDLSGSPKLELLDLSDCESLVEVHPSVGSLKKLVKLDLSDCSNLVTLPGEVNWPSLQMIRLHYCRKLESFPEIMGEMKYMRSLFLIDTGIKELPSSIRYLINLDQLYIKDCYNLTNVPGSIYELHRLKDIELYGCPRLVTFPNKVESQVIPTCSKVSHDDPHSSSAGCSSLDPDKSALHTFLVSSGYASTLRELNLSENPIVTLPEYINEFVNLEILYLSGCRMLVEIPELPPRIARLGVSGCVSLERISKLSNILERKEESQKMIKWMNLTDCWRLCQNLVEMANEDDIELDADLFFRLLSSQQSGFTITFPVARSEVPEWFSCQMDFKGFAPLFEFWIDTLENFKCENTGLAIWVAFHAQGWQGFDVRIYINEVEVCRITQNVGSEESMYHAGLHYKPFHEMGGADYRLPLPPFTCRVIINGCSIPSFPESYIKSCGVHLVMPPNEGVCMKLIHQQIPRRLS